MAAPVLQLKRGLFSNLPGLRAGEPGFTTDKYDLYVGIDSTSVNNQFIGSGRFWTVETSSTGSGVNLVEGTSNGTNYITLASPASLAGIVTYYLPGTQGAVSSVLTNDGSGNLTWASGSANPVFTGIATFNTSWVDINSDVDISGITTVTNTTDNTLGNADTGAFQIDGGLGVNKNVTVGGNLNVQGHSEFVGVVTFRGGTINLGDANTDDIVVAGEFASSLVPTDDATYDIGGDASKQWRNANFAGIGTFDGGLDIGGEASLASATVEDLTSGRVVLAGTGGALEDSGNLTFNGTTLNVTGNATVDNVRIDGNEIDTTSGGLTLDSASGTVTVDDDLTINGNFTVLGTQSIINTETLKVEDSLIEVGLVNSGGSLVPPSSDANIDVGVVLHYYSGSAKTAAMFWDDSAGRIVVASEVTESTSVMGSITYANLEIGALTVTDCQGNNQAVITCSGSTRTLENITVDGGSF